MQKINTIIRIWRIFAKDHKHIATFPSWIPYFSSKYLSILFKREFYSKFYSNYFYGGFLKGLFRLILAMKLRARIFTLCFVTIFFSLKRSFFLSYFICFWIMALWDWLLSFWLFKVPVKSLRDSAKKLPGVTLKSSSYSRCMMIKSFGSWGGFSDNYKNLIFLNEEYLKNL